MFCQSFHFLYDISHCSAGFPMQKHLCTTLSLHSCRHSLYILLSYILIYFVLSPHSWCSLSPHLTYMLSVIHLAFIISICPDHLNTILHFHTCFLHLIPHFVILVLTVSALTPHFNLRKSISLARFSFSCLLL